MRTLKPHADNVDQIMGQMRSLQIQPTDQPKQTSTSATRSHATQVVDVDERTKVKIIKWLIEEIKLIGSHISQQSLMLNLPKFCRNGVLFADLLNRLNGRD